MVNETACAFNATVYIILQSVFCSIMIRWVSIEMKFLFNNESSGKLSKSSDSKNSYETSSTRTNTKTGAKAQDDGENIWVVVHMWQ